jgi:uncharacterized membrane protein
MSPDSAALPPVRSVPFTSPLSWLARGWRDLWKAGGASLLQGAAVAVFSLLLWVLGRDKFGLLVGALSGFLVMAPVLATGFYVLSRSLERGAARMAEVLRTGCSGRATTAVAGTTIIGAWCAWAFCWRWLARAGC